LDRLWWRLLQITEDDHGIINPSLFGCGCSLAIQGLLEGFQVLMKPAAKCHRTLVARGFNGQVLMEVFDPPLVKAWCKPWGFKDAFPKLISVDKGITSGF
jgi:hypothetical protein